MSKDLMTNTCVRLSQETLDKLKEVAEQKRRKVSELMRLIMEDYLKSYNDRI